MPSPPPWRTPTRRTRPTTASRAHLVRDLGRLDAAYATTLAACRIRTVVVSHDAFEYLARRYGLDVVPIAGLEPDAEPSLQRLYDLARLIPTAA